VSRRGPVRRGRPANPPPRTLRCARGDGLGARPFLVLEYIDGFDLPRVLRPHGAIPVGVALRVACALLEALAHAWGYVDPDGGPLRIVHRDLSPSNVLLSRRGRSASPMRADGACVVEDA
jgi:serine/threonine protein kinase